MFPVTFSSGCPVRDFKGHFEKGTCKPSGELEQTALDYVAGCVSTGAEACPSPSAHAPQKSGKGVSKGKCPGTCWYEYYGKGKSALHPNLAGNHLYLSQPDDICTPPPRCALSTPSVSF